MPHMAAKVQQHSLFSNFHGGGSLEKTMVSWESLLGKYEFLFLSKERLHLDVDLYVCL